MSLETLILVPIAAVALMAAVLAFARLAQSWKEAAVARRSGEGGPVAEAPVADEDRAYLALRDEKERLLLTLRDLEQEYQAGKLSDADYRALEARFQVEALAVMKKMGNR